LAFGAAIMHEPRVLFLDEPTSGVDPVARRAFWRLIHRLADQGVAILVTTHYLEEAEQCNRLGLMAAGELIAQGAPGEVKKLARGRLIEIEADEPLRSAAALKARYGNRSVSLFGHRLHLALEQPEETPERIRELLADLRTGPRRVEEIEFSLEDVFISLVGRDSP
jgi:ABC-2 type transport system ATP-binding protein